MRRVGLYIVLVVLIGCDRQPDKSDALSAGLEKTFADSKLVMSDFMDKWSKDSSVLSNNNPTDLETNFLAIYKEVFSPFSYKLYGWDKWADWTPFTGTRYIVVQSEVPYTIVDQVDTLVSDYNYVDTLKHFFPKVSFENVTTLYLNTDYRNTFIKFLGDPRNESEREIFREKVDFLENTLKLSHGYNWRAILTQPIVDGICISKDFKEATVDFNIVSSGLRSYLVKENDKWTIKTTKETWIE